MKKFFFYALAFVLLVSALPESVGATVTQFSQMNGSCSGAGCPSLMEYIEVSSGFQAYRGVALASYTSPAAWYGPYIVEDSVTVVTCLIGTGVPIKCMGGNQVEVELDDTNPPYKNYTGVRAYAEYYCMVSVEGGPWGDCRTAPGGGITSLGVTAWGRTVSIDSMQAPASQNIGQSFPVSWTTEYAGPNTNWVSISSSANISCGGISTNGNSHSASCVGTSVGNGTVTVSAKGPMQLGGGNNEKTVTQAKSVNIVASGGGGDVPPPPPPGSYNLTLNKSGAGVGTVTSSPAGISCGTTCSSNSGSFTSGASVTLTASAASGSTFAGWSGACSGTGSCVVSMTVARTVTATFNSAPVPCGDCANYVSHIINGVPNPTAMSLVAGTQYTASYTYKNTGTNTWTCCTPFASWHPFYGYPDQGIKISTINRRPDIADLVTVPTYTNHTGASTPTNGFKTYTFNFTTPATTGTYELTMAMLRDFSPYYFGDQSPMVTVTVTPNTPRALTVTKAGTGTGTVTSSPAGINCGGTCTANFVNGTSVTLTASPTSGSTFAGWSGACSGTGSCVVSMTAARSVTATFTAIVPSIISTTISPNPAIPNGSTAHTVTVVASHPNGGANINYQYALINIQGANAGTYRGYAVWGVNSWGALQKDNMACTGGGYGALLINDTYSVYGSQYLELDACTTTLSGNNRTVTFTVKLNNANSGSGVNETRAFTTPATNNTVSGYARDADAVATGWVAGTVFSLTTAPSIVSATISPTPANNNGTTAHTITIVGNHSSGGTNISQLYGIINHQGTNTGQYRGYITWGSANNWPTHKDSRACTGGGYAAIQSEGGQSIYGPQYVELDSCATSVSGSNRTATFTVRFNTNFTTPTTNNTLSGYANVGGNVSGWVPGTVFSLVAPAFDYSLSSSGATNVTKGSGTTNVQNTITKTLTTGTGQAVTLAVSGLPSGVSVQSITNQGCTLPCSASVITLAVSPSAPTGAHTITITGSPLSRTTTFTLNISGNPMSVSCTAVPSTVLVGQSVTWTANVTGGTGPYTYAWSGSEGLTGTTASVQKSYSTIGVKNATVTVTDADSATAQCNPVGTAQVYFNPVFEEF